MPFYRDIGAERVDAGLRDAAERALLESARELGLNCPVISWYEPAPRAGADVWEEQKAERGHCRALRPGVIWLNASQTRQEAVETAAHEARHLWQWRNGYATMLAKRVTPAEHTANEHDAESYALGFARRFAGGQRLPSPPPFRPANPEAKQLMAEAGRLLRCL